ncbi:MAG: hypothetical protein VYC34_12170 [Planctomycetota bacterium]|nr:hypothetical protein [Planctomycetota bacterium]
MKYRIAAARLMAATHGDSYDPTTCGAPNELGQKFAESKAIQQTLSECTKNWTSSDVANSKDAAKEVCREIGTQLSVALKKDVAMDVQETAYLPILDPSGTPVGHETIGWLYIDKKLLKKQHEHNGEPLYRWSLACIYVALSPV